MVLARLRLAILLPLAACATPAPDGLVTVRQPGLVAAPPAGVRDAEARTLARDARGLEAFAGDPDPAVRAAVATGLGRVQDVSARAVLGRLLADPAPAVRERAAGALGLLGLAWDEPSPAVRDDLTELLLAAAGVETETAVLAQLAWSLGRAGGAHATGGLAGLLGHPAAPVRAQAAYALGFHARFHPDRLEAPPGRAAAAAELAGLRRDADAEVRSGVAFALAMLKEPAAAEAAAALARDGDAQVRAFAARALGEVAPDPSLLEALVGDPDPRVRVEAVRGLHTGYARVSGGAPVAASAAAAGSASPQAPRRSPAREDAFEDALVRAADSLSRVAKRKGGALASQPLEMLVRPPAGAVPEAVARKARDVLGDPLVAPPALRRDVARLSCLAAAALDRARGELAAVPGCGKGLVPAEVVARHEAAVLGDLLEHAKAPPDAAPARLAELLAAPAPSVRMAALEAAGKLPAVLAHPHLDRALSDPDAGVVAAAAEAAAAAKDAESRAPLVQALGRYGTAAQAETAQSIVGALGALGAGDAAAIAAVRAALADRRPAVRTAARGAYARLTSDALAAEHAAMFPRLPPDPPPATGGAGRVVVLRTEKGTIRIELDPARAPIAAANLRELARRGFYDGLGFHRVEPAFVVQGGDPRGDGSGGPGFAIPCENEPTPYVRGTVGMALSGKDTGGSQFFVTHGRTPHLEGRYTAFGRVVSGMEVVDRLLAGDRIVRASVE